MSQSLEQGKRKLTAKDAITAGALGAVCIAIRFLFMLVGGVSPYVWFAPHFIDAILIGPVFMLMVAKVRKNGPFLLTSLITGVVLGIGRAIGEAMAIMMVSGNVVNIPLPFNSVRFLTTGIVTEMSYSSGLHRQALFSIGLVLFVFIMVINILLNTVLKKGGDANGTK